MTQEYPYFTVARIAAGQMVKLTKKKFSSEIEANDYIIKLYSKIPVIRDKEQFVILKYDLTYDSKIQAIFNKGKKIIINK